VQRVHLAIYEVKCPQNL